MLKTFKLAATCAAGIESIVSKELKNMGYEVKNDNGIIYFNGTIEDIIKTNLWLRTADRILIIINQFEATSFTELFDNVYSIDWQELLSIDSEFPVNGRSKNSDLHSVPDIQKITKKAIVQKMSDFYHKRGRLQETGAKFDLETRINKNQVTMTLDTTGDSLFKRGYRVAKGEAPLKENMAAALIKLTNWNPIDMPFLDPMCGSGTIPIEAAMIARNIAPGFNRDFSFEKWEWVDDDLVQKLRDEADSKADYDSEFKIFASDINETMIKYAKLNAQEAGLLHDINFKQVSVQDFQTELINGVVVSNPPYGIRLDNEKSVNSLYSDLGKKFKPMKTWSKYFLTSELNFENYYDQKANKKRKLYNGRIRTDYFQYFGKPKWN
ncbi:class I SAM-dependent RNA methyltransferase [Lactobacillus sp. S2-2]|uniref:THUMP domain-containing class I SAM-dependent RNA methyltransferase n=1 Tax=Lactobacillus sp. S2-2 TaxID=2692917 RepID=UPI001F32754E|nr:class I SAM-dependent RNA methyltransferase [Lactobacillus sp. S2-2]MCF6515065.1 class I SAM-dependent RNA methyltransferase [Lactobacillus sp. S2-2]